MSDTNKDEQFIQTSKKLLQHNVEQVDEMTAVKLKAARMLAVQRAQEKLMRPGWWPLSWPSTTAIGALATLVLVVGLWWINPIGPGNVNHFEMEDMALVAAQEQWELYEDWEFYRWLSDSEYAG